jgi:exonuclease SbcC
MQKALQEKLELVEENRERCKHLTDDLSEIANAEKLLITIGPTHEEYESKKARLDELEPSIFEIQELTNKKSQLTTAIEKEKTHLEKAISELQSTLTVEKEKICKQKIATLKIPELSKTETRLSEEVEELPTVSDLLASLSQENSATKQDVKNKRERVKELKDELAELRKIGIGAPCPKCKQELTQAHYSKVEQNYLNEIENLEKKITDLSSKTKENDAKIVENSAKEKALKDVEKKLNKLRPELAKLKQQEERLKEDEENFDKKQEMLEKNKKLLSQEDYAKNERKQLAETLAKLEELSPLQKEYETIKERLKTLEKMKAQEQYLTAKEKASKKDEVTKELAEKRNRVEALDSEAKRKKELIDQKQKEYDQEKPVLQKLKDLEAKKEDFDRKLQGKNGDLVGKRKDIQRSEEESKRIAGEIKTREDQLLKLQELNQYQLWLSELFIPAVKLIETNVLANINSEFNSLFQKWLGHLLEGGDITVRVDENFTPIIEQNGYEMDVDSLSGGEKTSVALAYRLALNVMVKKVCEAMQSNLLILDEPTDGFSREQLFRLRDILSELKCEQVIAVSHESELEGFVDKIYRITKEAGESKISAA